MNADLHQRVILVFDPRVDHFSMIENDGLMASSIASICVSHSLWHRY